MQILVATGGAPHSENAVHLAGKLAAATGGTVTVLTVVTSRDHRAQAERIAGRAAEALAQHTSTVDLRVRVGRRAGVIAQEAKAGGYDLLMMGENPHHRLVRRVVPTTVEQVMEQMPCPVLVARTAVLPERFLVCESGRHPLVTKRAATKLGPLLALGREVTLLHVMSQMAAGPGVRDWALRADAQEHIRRKSPEGKLLQEGLHALAGVAVQTRPLLRHGPVVSEILRETQTGGYDLVIIGAYRAARWERLVLADQAHAIRMGIHESFLIV